MYTIRGLFTNAQVINNIMTGPYKSLYNPENVYRNEAGGGAGNNWAQGYAAGEKAADELIFCSFERMSPLKPPMPYQVAIPARPPSER